MQSKDLGFVKFRLGQFLFTDDRSWSGSVQIIIQLDEMRPQKLHKVRRELSGI